MVRNFEPTNWIFFTSTLHMQLVGVFLNLKNDICTCNVLIFFTVIISILSRWKAIISKKLMKLFRAKVNIRLHFILIPTNLVINVRQWTWLICEKYTTFINWIISKLKMISLRPKTTTYTTKTTWISFLHWYILPTYIFGFRIQNSRK
jgi:hypothetical protein